CCRCTLPSVFADTPVTFRPFPQRFTRELPHEHLFSASPAPPSAVALQTPFPATTITPDSLSIDTATPKASSGLSTSGKLPPGHIALPPSCLFRKTHFFLEKRLEKKTPSHEMFVIATSLKFPLNRTLGIPLEEVLSLYLYGRSSDQRRCRLSLIAEGRLFDLRE